MTGIVDATIAANQNQMKRMVDKIVSAIGAPRGKRVGVLGLSFKPNTDDLREAPALTIIAGLKRRGIQVRAFDPVSMPGARKLSVMKGVDLVDDAYEAARGADALAIITEWNEFRNLSLGRLKRLMRRPVLCDLRNLYDPAEVEAAGLKHLGVGRGRVAAEGRRKGTNSHARGTGRRTGRTRRALATVTALRTA
jgi:UDPglucose 6-dehydrogenase